MNACGDNFGTDAWVCRSLLDRKVWFTHADEHDDLSDYEHPGGLRAVKRYAASRYGGGQPTRWKVVNPDTWELHCYPYSCDKEP